MGRPTAALVRAYVAAFDANPRCTGPDRAVRSMVEAFPLNTETGEVLAKVAVINALFGTNIYDPVPVAHHIRDLDIDEALSGGDLGLVERIADFRTERNERRLYSFASKYCAWHRPDHYPMYDSRVDASLWHYRKRFAFTKFTRVSLSQYPAFFRVIHSFGVAYGLEQFSLRELDKFLWLRGRRLIERTRRDRAQKEKTPVAP